MIAYSLHCLPFHILASAIFSSMTYWYVDSLYFCFNIYSHNANIFFAENQSELILMKVGIFIKKYDSVKLVLMKLLNICH